MSELKHNIVWNNCLQIIKDTINPQSFKTWFEPIQSVKLADSILTIEVPSPFFMEYIEANFVELLSKILVRELGKSAKLEYRVKVVEGGEKVTMPQQSNQEFRNKPLQIHHQETNIENPFVIPGIKQIEIDPQLNPKNAFANFIQGDCNRLARMAGLKIAENPGKSAFNPLFLYGGSGLGKTHLAQAIGIAIKEKFPEKIVLYVSAHRFQFQFMDAVNNKNKMTDFIHFYQMIDVLIIDDVHEFSGKSGTQNAFFSIFTHLHNTGKQLILTCDKSPSELQELDTRLLSRFKWGLSAELSVPDFFTKVSIIKAKSYYDGINLSDEVINFIANKSSNNIREIEGLLISLLAEATFNNRKITLELAESLVDKLITANKVEISIPEIQKTVCNYFKISPELLLSRSRKRELVQARQIAMYLSKNLTNNSLTTIGAQTGGKDHTTVLHACKTVRDLMDTDKIFKKFVVEIEKQLHT